MRRHFAFDIFRSRHLYLSTSRHIAVDNSLSYSSSQIAHTPNHGHQRFNSSTLSQKKRGRPRLYEHGPYTNKSLKSRSLIEGTKSTIPNATSISTRLLMPREPTMASMNNIYTNSNNSSLIYSNQRINHTTTVPVKNTSLLQQQQYSYPSLLVDKTSSTNILAASTLSSRTTSTPRPSAIMLTTTTIPNAVQSNFSSIKSFNQTQNNDVIIHNNEEEKENDGLPSDPKEWTIVQVGEFIGQITNETIAEGFRKSEVDGKALLLLEKEDLRHDMNIKLGPSVKILNKIKELREREQ